MTSWPCWASVAGQVPFHLEPGVIAPRSPHACGHLYPTSNGSGPVRTPEARPQTGPKPPDVLYCRYARQPILRLVGLARWLVGGGVGAQAPQAPAPRHPGTAGAGPGTASRSRPSASTIDFVTMDAIVRNDQDQFVADLTKDDFEILRRRRQAGHHVADAGARRPRAQPAGAAAAADAGRHHPAAVAAAQRHRRPHLPDHRRRPAPRLPQHRPHPRSVQADLEARWSTKATCSRSSRPARRRSPIDPTYDRKVLDEAIKKITGNGLKPSDIIQGAEGADGPAEVRYRAHVAFSTAYDMLRQMEKHHQPPQGGGVGEQRLRLQSVRRVAPRRGSGVRRPLRPDARRRPAEQREQFNQGQQFADADLARELAEVTRTANRANATLYTIDPRGLVAGADLDEQLDPVEYGEHVRKTQDSLRVLAERDRRHRGRQPERLRQGAEADRRRDERLLHAGLLLDEPGSAEADAEDRGEAVNRPSLSVMVADVVFAAVSCRSRRNADAQKQSTSWMRSRSQATGCGCRRTNACHSSSFRTTEIDMVARIAHRYTSSMVGPTAIDPSGRCRPSSKIE